MSKCNCSPIVPNSHHESCPKYKAIVESIKILAASDHGFLGEETVRRVTEPFGFVGHTYLAKANPQDFKGLTLWDKDGNQISEARGQDAHKVAMEVCDHLGIKYEDYFGVGSQLSECVSKLRKFWGIN